MPSKIKNLQLNILFDSGIPTCIEVNGRKRFSTVNERGNQEIKYHTFWHGHKNSEENYRANIMNCKHFRFAEAPSPTVQRSSPEGLNAAQPAARVVWVIDRTKENATSEEI